jgi:hypothetical protein
MIMHNMIIKSEHASPMNDAHVIRNIITQHWRKCILSPCRICDVRLSMGRKYLPFSHGSPIVGFIGTPLAPKYLKL